jgi:disulfide oxidoreductase YuzD
MFSILNKDNKEINIYLLDGDACDVWKVSSTQGKFASPFKKSKEKIAYISLEDRPKYESKLDVTRWVGIFSKLEYDNFQDLKEKIKKEFQYESLYLPFIVLIDYWVKKGYTIKKG